MVKYKIQMVKYNLQNANARFCSTDRVLMVALPLLCDSRLLLSFRSHCPALAQSPGRWTSVRVGVELLVLDRSATKWVSRLKSGKHLSRSDAWLGASPRT